MQLVTKLVTDLLKSRCTCNNHNNYSIKLYCVEAINLMATRLHSSSSDCQRGSNVRIQNKGSHEDFSKEYGDIFGSLPTGRGKSLCYYHLLLVLMVFNHVLYKMYLYMFNIIHVHVYTHVHIHAYV